LVLPRQRRGGATAARHAGPARLTGPAWPGATGDFVTLATRVSPRPHFAPLDGVNDGFGEFPAPRPSFSALQPALSESARHAERAPPRLEHGEHLLGVEATLGRLNADPEILAADVVR
jgi:hypothetical protein